MAEWHQLFITGFHEVKPAAFVHTGFKLRSHWRYNGRFKIRHNCRRLERLASRPHDLCFKMPEERFIAFSQPVWHQGKAEVVAVPFRTLPPNHINLRKKSRTSFKSPVHEKNFATLHCCELPFRADDENFEILRNFNHFAVKFSRDD